MFVAFDIVYTYGTLDRSGFFCRMVDDRLGKCTLVLTYSLICGDRLSGFFQNNLT